MPEPRDHDFIWNPVHIEEQQSGKDLPNKVQTTSLSLSKTRKRPTLPSSIPTNHETGRRSSRQKNNTQTKDEEQPPLKNDKRKSIKESPRISTRALPNSDSIGTRLRGQK